MHQNEILMAKDFDAGSIQIRRIAISDMIKMHILYDSLSETSKAKYHSKIYGFPTSSIWVVAQIFIIISTIINKKNRIFFIYQYLNLAIYNRENQVLGYGHLSIQKGNELTGFTARLGLLVADNYQGCGLGTLLLNELISNAKQLNIKIIQLDVLHSNESAKHLYEKFGFKYLEKQNDNILSMQLLVDD